jgi:hypothetical protein
MTSLNLYETRTGSWSLELRYQKAHEPVLIIRLTKQNVLSEGCIANPGYLGCVGDFATEMDLKGRNYR